MLATLFVSDLALIRRLSVDFHRGFSVLTGETGAGKSLILDSLNLFLSTSSPKELVRHGAEKMEVSLFFDEISSDAARALEEFLPAEEIAEGVSLSRVVTKEGKSSCKCNGRSMPFSRVRELASVLLAIHGQMSSSGLLDEKNHRLYLDSALPPEGQAALEEYRTLYGEYQAVKKELDEMQSAGDEKELLALYEFQMAEIARIKPRAGEEEALEKKLALLQSSEKTRGALYTASRALSGGEKGRGAVFLLEAAAAKLDALGEGHPLYPHSAELYDLARRAKEIAEETSFALSELGEEDPAELMDRIRKRIDALYQLKLKYGGTVEEVLQFYQDLKRKKDLTESRKDDIKRALKKLDSLREALEKSGEKLSCFRKQVSSRLEEEIGEILAFLDMPKMRFFVSLEPVEIGPWGKEKVSFAISPNTGEGTKPLSRIASGGELSRIMLALQLKLGAAKDADTLVFDEIDTGISGATSQKIGICLRTLAERKQVFCVTHSAQVASLATGHFLVEKREDEGRTETLLTPLDEDGSLRENGRLLGGKAIGDEALGAARRLKEEGLEEWMKWKQVFLA